MTVIAFDGRSVAIDRQGTSGGWSFPVTKYRRHQQKVLTFAGSASIGHALIDWFISGCNPEKFPNKGLDPDDAAHLWVFERGKPPIKFEEHPYPIVFEIGTKCADGSGRDFALAAMHMGASAEEAVAVASALSISCGHGVDVIHLD